VIRKTVPHRGAAADLPPFSRPGLRGLRKFRLLERLRWIAWNGVEPPRLLTGLGVVGIKEAAHSVLPAADANDDLSTFDNPGRHRDRIRHVFRRDSRFPEDLSGFGV